MQIDNPKHRDHYRYHLIVDRVAHAVIGILICLLIAEVTGHWTGILILPIAIAVLLIAWAAIVSILAVVLWFLLGATKFFTGY